MFQALIGPALSFGSSLISGLGARQSAKKQQKMQAAYEYQNYLLQERANNYNRNITENRNSLMAGYGDEVLKQWNPTNIAKHADAAGFNPATWLMGMGGSYASMQQYGYELKRPELVYDTPYMQNAPTAQVPSVGEAVGGALQAGVNTYLSDQRAIDSRNFQREMMATQIAAIQANRGRPGSAMGVPASQRTFFGSGEIPYAVGAGRSAIGGVVQTKPAENTTTVPGFPGIEPGFSPDLDYGRSATGYPIQPGKIAKERNEDDIFQQLSWWMRNNVASSFGYGSPPPHAKLKRGREWGFDVFNQEWQQRIVPLPFPGAERFGYRTEDTTPRGGWSDFGISP